jgi:hypothetical protein
MTVHGANAPGAAARELLLVLAADEGDDQIGLRSGVPPPGPPGHRNGERPVLSLPWHAARLKVAIGTLELACDSPKSVAA